MADSSNTIVHLAENSPEQIAYRLMTLIAAVEDRELYSHGKNPADRTWILDTYSECLQAVKNPNRRS